MSTATASPAPSQPKGTEPSPPSAFPTPVLPQDHQPPRQSAVGRFLAEWGWLVGVLAGPVAAAIFGYLARVDVSSLSIQVFLGVTLLFWIVVLVVWLVWVESPSGEMLRVVGRRCSVFEDVRTARAEIVSDIHRTVRELPEMDEDSLEEVDGLVQAAGVAKELMRGLGRAMALRKWFALSEVLIWPVAAVISVFLGVVSSDPGTALTIGLLTAMFGVVLFALLGLDVVVRSARWGSRVSVLMGEDHTGVRRLIERWAEGRRP